MQIRIEKWRKGIFDTIGYDLHCGQARLIEAYLNYHFVWCCAGRRGGKSDKLARIVFSEFSRPPKTAVPGERWPKKILILAPEYKQARIIFGKVYRLVKEWGIPLSTDRFSAQEMELETPWGALIMCMTGRNKDAWPGFDWDLVVADEVPLFKDGRAFEELIFPTLLDANGKFLGIGTPDFPGSFSHKWMLQGIDPDNTDWQYVHWTTLDNWFLQGRHEFIKKQRRLVPDDIIRRQYFAEYVSKSGLVYKEYQDCIEDFDMSVVEAGRWHRAGDFGFINPFACLTVAQVGDYLYVVDEYYESEKNLSEHAPNLRAMDNEYPFHRRNTKNLWDPEDPGGIDYLRAWKDSSGNRIKGVWITDYSKGNIPDRIDLVRRMMMAGLIRIHPRCKQLIWEYSMYSYPDKKVDKPSSEKPVDKNNHAIKALEYLTEYIFGDSFKALDIELLTGRRSTRRSIQVLKGY